MYEWLVDNDFTPHILVDALAKHVSVPPSAVRDDRVLLNVAPRAVFGLNLGNEYISFKASFGGSQREVNFPVQAVLAIYAREDIQHGIVFAQEAEDDQSPPDDEPPPATEPERTPERKGRANLRVVK